MHFPLFFLYTQQSSWGLHVRQTSKRLESLTGKKKNWVSMLGSKRQHSIEFSEFSFCLLCPRLEAKEHSFQEMLQAQAKKKKIQSKLPLSKNQEMCNPERLIRQ